MLSAPGEPTDPSERPVRHKRFADDKPLGREPDGNCHYFGTTVLF